MKFTILIAFFIASCAFVSALPVDLFEDEPAAEIEDQHKELVRVKRVSCDVLSFEAFGVKVNDAACASHCLTLRKRGGYCNGKKVCVCRN